MEQHPLQRRGWGLHCHQGTASAAVGLLALCTAMQASADVTTRHSPGLGAVLTTKDGGQIYGFDIDQAGDDGVLASAQNAGGGYLVSVETFDQNTGKIAKSFAKYEGPRNSYAADGIFAGDVGLVTHYVVPDGQIYAKRKYSVLNPVTGNKFTGAWTPPIKDVDVLQAAPNQATSTAVLFAIELKKQDKPVLFVSDVAANTFTKVIHLDPNLFGLADGPRLGQFTANDQAVFALSPDGGAVGGQPPVNVLIDLSSGKAVRFNGYNNGAYHAGAVNGLAVDPNTGVAATTTELNSQVEFYDLNKKAGITYVQLPCTTDTDQLNSGTSIANDPVNKLFLVTDLNYCDGSEGGAVVVYDEAGNLIETITGFDPNAQYAVDQPPPRINPSKRMGWAFSGPQGFSQLQQFFY